MIKVIIFDFDGVIINEYQAHFELSKKQITGLTEDEFKRLFEGNIHSEREKLKSRDTGFDIKYHFDEHKKKVIIPEKTRVVLRALSKKFILGIISSAKESGAIECLKNSHLEGVFSFIYGFETHKLKTEKFDVALKNNKISKDECVFVTDTLGDILEAAKMGIRTIAVDYGYHDTKTLSKGNPIKIISSLSELGESIEQL
ncbi:HAD family hydrolase [Nanoarchaeota archaeon]